MQNEPSDRRFSQSQIPVWSFHNYVSGPSTSPNHFGYAPALIPQAEHPIPSNLESARITDFNAARTEFQLVAARVKQMSRDEVNLPLEGPDVSDSQEESDSGVVQ